MFDIAMTESALFDDDSPRQMPLVAQFSKMVIASTPCSVSSMVVMVLCRWLKDVHQELKCQLYQRI